jgi:hypothetical protein
MIDLHIPIEPEDRHSLKASVEHITRGLDAVMIGKPEASAVYEGCSHIRIDGNRRDVATAVERASRLGAVVD